MTWLIDSRGLARKVKSATRPSAYQIRDCGANRECPKCRHRIDNTDVSHEWPGLPAGVKFDPSDVELLEHLAAKCGVGTSKPHMFIDEFIPTLEGDEGICYTHPENLPGAKTDGSSVHFFHRTVNAYATGQRKRRKIHNEHNLELDHVRWHKTGKTKPIMGDGVQKGCKKIMVLYKASKKGSKPDKSSWVMHQYHLGIDEDEKEGQYVVSKIFYQQQKQNEKPLIIGDPDMGNARTSPRTPKTSTPNPPRPGKSVSCDDILDDDYAPQSSVQVTESIAEMSRPSSSTAQFKDDMERPSSSTGQFKDDMEYSWLAGESQDVDAICPNDSLLCDEILDSFALFDDLGLNRGPLTSYAHCSKDVPESATKTGSGIAELENLELDTPPDFQLADLQFGSQDSALGWLDRY